MTELKINEGLQGMILIATKARGVESIQPDQIEAALTLLEDRGLTRVTGEFESLIDALSDTQYSVIELNLTNEAHKARYDDILKAHGVYC